MYKPVSFNLNIFKQKNIYYMGGKKGITMKNMGACMLVITPGKVLNKEIMKITGVIHEKNF